MLSQKENEALTRVGPGTPMGELMRRYWIPAAFSHQIAEPDGPPVRVRLMGENLVLFRDTGGRVGLIDERCPHRTASMFFGRNEECGLRCVYHGLKFDVAGNCVDVPCVPQSSDVQKRNIRPSSRSRPIRASSAATWCGPIWGRQSTSRRFPTSNGPASRRRNATPPAMSRNATGCKGSKAASIPPTCRSCIAATPRRTATSWRRSTR